jgi:hypothetical protein
LTQPGTPAALISRQQALARHVKHAKDIRDFANGLVKRGLSLAELVEDHIYTHLRKFYGT